MSVVFCPTCHREAYRTEVSGGSVKVIQGSSTLLNVGKGSKVEMNLTCPAGHPVRLKLGEEGK